jgi:hypothetical protein
MAHIADAMKPINPTITWPNHTTLITGVNASEHHVMTNGFITPSDGSPLQVNPWVPKDELVHAHTLYDAAAEQGMSTGQVDWVAISSAGNVRWAFAEVPDPNGPIADDLIHQGLVTHNELVNFHSSSPAWTDEIWTADRALHVRYESLLDAPQAELRLALSQLARLAWSCFVISRESFGKI